MLHNRIIEKIEPVIDFDNDGTVSHRLRVNAELVEYIWDGARKQKINGL